MKKVFTFISAFCLSALLVEAQETSLSQPNGDGSRASSKTRFVQNGDYLSKSTLNSYQGFYGDSLAGFDEESMKADLLAKGVYGSEYQNFILLQKRAYINNKYKIGNHAGLPVQPVVASTPPASTGGKNIGGPAQINLAPCVNEDFESSAIGQYTGANGITGWTVESGMNGTTIYTPNTTYGAACNANAYGNWNQGSPELWVVGTPILNVPSIGNLGNSPLGGTKVLKMQDTSPNGLMTRIKSTFPVTTANTLFQFAYAGSWDGVHECCGQPAFRIDMYSQQCSSGTPSLMACSNVSLTPSGQQCSSGVPGYTMTGSVSWTNWVVRYIDLTPYIGMCVTIVVTNSDCSYSGHHGSAYFDAMCGGQLIGTGLSGIGGNIPGPVSFCAGSNVAMISAPLGYSTYSWIPPITSAPIPPSQATLSTLTVSNPIPGSVYTVNLTGASGCQFISTNTIVFSQVNIAGIGAGTTCIGGASGSATVQGNGSGSGYNYTWISAMNSATVGTTAVVQGLAPGVYSVVLTGLGAQGCGSAVATTTVTTGIPDVIQLIKPFCGNEAYLSMPNGSQYQWYNGFSPISSTNGGTAASYTVTNPVNNSVYWLSYMSQYGCKDSVKYTLSSTPPGIMQVNNISWICPGGNNGTAVVNMTTAANSPPGVNSFSVWATGLTPAYNSSVAVTSATNFPLSGLAAGSYTVRAFDGSCKYGTAFTVKEYTFNVNATPLSTTLCPGSSISANVTFPTNNPPGTNGSQYTYSWTPNLWLAGNAATYSQTIISPTVPVGTQSTVIYTITVVPNVVNCPKTTTLQITAINPTIPSVPQIQPICNTTQPFQIAANPPGGTFSTGITGTASPISLTGIISPTLANNGVNTFTYTIAVDICKASTTATYEVSTFNTAALTTPTVAPMCVTSSPLNLMNIVQLAGGTWSTASAPNNLNGGIFNPAGLNTNSYLLTYKNPSSPNPNTCPDVSNIIVPVTATVVPTINGLTEFCTNASSKTLTAFPAGGTWYNNSAVTSAGIVTPTLAAVPQSIAYYSVTVGPCQNFGQTVLKTSQFVPATLSGSVINQCEKWNPVNLLAISQFTTGTWSGTGVTSNSFSPQGLNTGTYTLTYNTVSTPNPGLCPHSQAITVHVYNPEEPQISNLGPFCTSQTGIQLTAAPATGKWTQSAYVDANGIFTPSLASVGANPVQYVVGTPTCNSQETKMINVEAFVSAKIMNKIGDQCNTGSLVNLGPLALSSGGNWSGPGVSGTSFNPGLTGAGTFSIVHKTASSPSGLCPDEDIMAVNVFSLAAPEITKVKPLCNSALPIQLQVSPVGGIFGGAAMGVVSEAGKFNPGSAQIGNNIINYSITSGPCVAYAQTTINVERFVSADFAKYVDPICLEPGKNNPINMDSYVQNAGGDWSGPGMVGNMFDPNAAPIGKSTVLTYYTNSASKLCEDSSAVRIEIRPKPVVTALSNIDKACSPAEIIFNTPSVTEGTGTWYFDDGSAPQNGFILSHVYDQPGTYNATFAYKDDVGCEAEPAKVKTIVVHEIPKADFSIPDEILISNPEVQLTNLTTVLGNNTYQWKISNTYIYTDVNPVVNFPKVGKYQITLVATTPIGCKDEVTKTVEVKNDFNVYIPTSFSPNFDNLNDYFMPVFSEYGLDVKSYEMEIFDRWGHTVYRTKDISKGWDGSVNNKGEILKEETYIYRIKYKDLDGNAYSKMGHVTLLK